MAAFRLKLIFAIVFLIILSLGIIKNVPAARLADPLGRAMEATGAKAEEFSVNAWVKLPSGELSNDQLEHLVQQVMDQLAVNPGQYQIIHKETSKQRRVQGEFIDKDIHVVVITEVNSVGTNESALEGYLAVIMEAKTEANLPIEQMQEKIAHITGTFGTSSQISTCLIGWLDGKLGNGDWHGILEKSFGVINATIMDELQSENFASYIGFTSQINNGLKIGEKKINVNMALRYSPYDNRTYVTIGSPIITREY